MLAWGPTSLAYTIQYQHHQNSTIDIVLYRKLSYKTLASKSPRRLLIP